MEIHAFRPAGLDLGSLEAAVAAIAGERIALAGRLAAARERRSALLLAGTPKDVAKADEAISAAEIEGQQLDALEASLTPAIQAARARNEADELAARRAQAVADLERFRAWWGEQFPVAVAALLTGIELERRAWANISLVAAETGLPPRVRHNGSLERLADALYLPSERAPHWAPPERQISTAGFARIG